MKLLTIITLVLVLVLFVARAALYGFDFGLISVWAGATPFEWGRTLLDGSAGAVAGAYAGICLVTRRF